ncbi:hypothetical protein BZG29_02170 [Janthinobacterium sp. LM6]|uniref:replication endonuclease n=1 Tax=Janthinobacterium sp. LM6 TaxID=1938606 RepID=UPI0009840374|nr:replication endonuclease [Janthinobacterium sp. LM6]AQR67294.1 hypothetical protein BZG29_02170 [Janthinobacterium sp. LM6]
MNEPNALPGAPARPLPADAAASASVPKAPFWTLPLPAAINTCSASSLPRKLRPSQQGVEALLAQALDAETTRLLGLAYSPLFPDEAPFRTLADIPHETWVRDGHILNAIARGLATYQAGLVAAAGEISAYIDYSEEDVRALAMKLAREEMPPLLKLRLAEKLLGIAIPGKTLAAQLARLFDARYWRRALRVRVLRAREHFFLRLHLIGKRGEAYASDACVTVRIAQLKRQSAWMRDTVLIPRYPLPVAEGENPYEPLTLEQVAPGPKERFAKLYTFVKAVDVLGQEASLASAMVTVTLEPEWHPNPSHGQASWNGASPREAHRSLCHRWQAILRDLHRVAIRLSGLRVAEPHKDACPHWHIWLLYRPEHENRILAAIMKYFPNKLKIRAPFRKGMPNTSADVMFDNRELLLGGASRALTHPKEGAQVEVSRINRDISSGASYAMKYLLKTVDAGDALNQQAGLFPADNDDATREKKRRHEDNAKRVDAYRSVWGLNQGQLFGIAKCLTSWDELRRLTVAPKHRLLKKLWALARGGGEEGRIEASASQRGDAVGFIKALGGLDACRNAKAKTGRRFSIGRLVEDSLNAYGETITRTIGVTLLLKRKAKVVKERVVRATGEIKSAQVQCTVTTVLTSVRTHLIEWMLVPKGLAKQVMERAELLEQLASEQVGIKRRCREERAMAETLRLEKVAKLEIGVPIPA